MAEVRRRVRWSGTEMVVAGLMFVCLLVVPGRAEAQGADKRWGVSLSFVPSWTGDAQFQERLYWADTGWPSFEGSAFSIGVARGAVHGGEWGVSYVRRPIKDQHVVETFSQSDCSGPNNAFCFSFDETNTTVSRSVLVNGIEVHVFVPVARFANRVQVGVNVGGGAGFPSGTATESFESIQINTQPNSPPQVFTDSFTEEGEAAGNVIGKIVPLILAEAQGDVLVAPGLKVRLAAGLNAPSKLGFRAGVVYFFGAR